MLDRLTPTWRRAALAALAFLVLWFCWSVRSVLNPLILGYLLAFVLHPLVLKLERRGWRPVARDAAIVAGLIALAGGFWLLRNLVESGNPFFPVKVELLGVTVFDAPRDTFREAIGYPLTHYLTDWSIWREWIVPEYRDSVNLPGALLAHVSP